MWGRSATRARGDPGATRDTDVGKDTLLAAAQGHVALFALIDRYLPDEIYRNLDDALQLIPGEGWQDLQGGNTPGGEPGVAGEFRESPVVRDEAGE